MFLLWMVIGLFLSTPPVRAQEDGGGFDFDWGDGEVLAAMTKRMVTPLPKMVADKDVNITEVVNQDLMVAGGDVDLRAVVYGDVFVAGGTVIIDGDIRGNLYAAGGQVLLRGNVIGKVIMAGGDLKIEEGAVVGGYLLATGGNVELSGTVNGDVRLAGGKAQVRPSSVLAGALTIDAGEITVADEAKVAGIKQITITEKKGKKWDAQSTEAIKTKARQIIGGVFFGFWLVKLLGQLVVMFVLVKFFGERVGPITKMVANSFWSNLGWGFGKLFLTPILVVILLLTVVGMPLAGLVTLIYIVAMAVSGYISAAVLGHFASTKGWLKSHNLYLQGVLGLLAIEVVGLIPFVGWLVKCAALLTGLGVIVHGEKLLFAKARK